MGLHLRLEVGTMMTWWLHVYCSNCWAGGPGKGMYSRLYTDVLNRFHWVESAEAFTSIHEESGLLGIDASCDPTNLPYLLQVIIDQLAQLQRTHVTQVELGRAKNMLKSMMFMQLESRLVLCEDI